jgi:adenylosuccinate lyase
VRALLTEAARFQSGLDVEAALARRKPSWASSPRAARHEIVRKAPTAVIAGSRSELPGSTRSR